jgi:hypothetical protein
MSPPATWNTLRSSCKLLDILVRFSPYLGSLDRFSYKSPVPNFTKIHLVGSALIHAERRTHLTKLVGDFRDYAMALKTASLVGVYTWRKMWRKLLITEQNKNETKMAAERKISDASSLLFLLHFKFVNTSQKNTEYFNQYYKIRILVTDLNWASSRYLNPVNLQSPSLKRRYLEICKQSCSMLDT